jgi:hypothetical protein
VGVLKRVHSTIRELLQLQDSIEEALKQVSSPLSRGRIVSDVRITAGQTVDVPHGLARVPQGYVVTKLISGSGDLIQSDGPFPDRLIRLSSSGGFRGDVLFF